jgi:hypothetical protein
MRRSYCHGDTGSDGVPSSHTATHRECQQSAHQYLRHRCSFPVPQLGLSVTMAPGPSFAQSLSQSAGRPADPRRQGETSGALQTRVSVANIAAHSSLSHLIILGEE